MRTHFSFSWDLGNHHLQVGKLESSIPHSVRASRPRIYVRKWGETEWVCKVFSQRLAVTHVQIGNAEAGFSESDDSPKYASGGTAIIVSSTSPTHPQ